MYVSSQGPGINMSMPTTHPVANTEAQACYPASTPNILCTPFNTLKHLKVLLPWTSIKALWIKPLLVMLTIHTEVPVPEQATVVLLLIQLPDNVPEKAEISPWTPVIHVEDQNLVIGS